MVPQTEYTHIRLSQGKFTFIMLYLGSIEMDCDINELCKKGTILQRNYRKTTILRSFSYNFYVKFHHHVISKSCYNEVCYKGAALYFLIMLK